MLKILFCIAAGALIVEPGLLSVDSLVKYRDVLIAYGLAALAYPWLSAQFE